MKNTNKLCVLIIGAFFLFISCGENGNIGDFKETQTSVFDTIQKLTEMHSKEVIWNDNGIYRRVTMMESYDPIDENEENPSENNRATCSDYFSGNDRKVAKISISSGSSRTHYTMRTFINTLQTDAFMKWLGISKSSSSGRVSQEDRNVYITTSYLYAIKHESDGDLHLIIGDPNKTYFFNCEASGYPSSSASSYTKIKTVKTTLVNRFATDFCGKTSYTVFSPPILVDVLKGSLFFDVDHSAGTVGPTGYRPSTAWEIHPISEIKF